MSETKPGMPSPALNEDDVRRLIREEMDLAFRGFYQQQAMQQLKVIESLGFTIVPQDTQSEKPDTKATQDAGADQS